MGCYFTELGVFDQRIAVILISTYSPIFGGTEFQNRLKKRRKHLLNLGSLEKVCF